MISFFITQINTFLTRKDHLCNLTKMTERWKSMKRRTECNWKMERHSNAEFSYITILIKSTAWKVTICGVFSGPYFPVFGLNTYRVLRSKPRYSVQIKENTDQKKLRIWTLFTQRRRVLRKRKSTQTWLISTH